MVISDKGISSWMIPMVFFFVYFSTYCRKLKNRGPAFTACSHSSICCASLWKSATLSHTNNDGSCCVASDLSCRRRSTEMPRHSSDYRALLGIWGSEVAVQPAPCSVPSLEAPLSLNVSRGSLSEPANVGLQSGLPSTCGETPLHPMSHHNPSLWLWRGQSGESPDRFFALQRWDLVCKLWDP